MVISASRRAASALVLAALSLTAACSTNDTIGASGTAASATSAGTAITVDAPATTSSSALYYGATHGTFTGAGLSVTPHNHTSSDSPLVGLIGNAYPIVWDNAADVLLAVHKNLPVTVVALGDLGTQGQLDVIVKSGSSATTLPGLAGKTIAIPGTTSSCAITIPAQLRAAGVDPGKVKLVPVALPDEGSALQRGIVDAVCAPEPFLSTIRASLPTRTVADEFTGPLTHTLVGVWVTTTSYAAAHPDVIAAFRKAIVTVNAALAGDPDALRAALPGFTSITATLAAQIKLPDFPSGVTDTAPIAGLAGLMHQAGLLTDGEVPAGLIASVH